MLWAVAFVVLIGALCGVLLVLKQYNIFQPELALTILIVASVVILLLGLAVTAVIFRRLGLHSRENAMGLPEGSIRAIIALMLIVIFAVTAVFLISNIDSQSESKPVTDLSEEQAAAYPAEDVVRTIEVPTGPETSTYTVILKGDEPASLALSQQLLTTLGTLVVAIASFYFGSNAVTSAQTAIARATANPESPLGENIPANGSGIDGSDPAVDAQVPKKKSGAGRQLNFFLGGAQNNRDMP